MKCILGLYHTGDFDDDGVVNNEEITAIMLRPRLTALAARDYHHPAGAVRWGAATCTGVLTRVYRHLRGR
jgi:hypothetical protein